MSNNRKSREAKSKGRHLSTNYQSVSIAGTNEIKFSFET